MKKPPQSEPTKTPHQSTGIVVIGDEESVEPYVRTLGTLEHVRVIGFLDGSRRSADAHPSVQSTDDPATAVGWSGVDAFIHCGAVARDPESLAMVAASGKPVFIDSRGGRYRADARTVRTCIETGEVGRVVFVRFAAGGIAGDAARSRGDELSWQQREHVLDMLGWWVGDQPDTVYAQRKVDYESVTVHYADGATAVCDISSAGPAYREVVVVGTAASISLTWADHASVLLPANGSGVQYDDGSPSLEAVLDEWLANVRTGEAPTVDASELDTAIALAEAVERSIASGEIALAKASRVDEGQS